MTKCSARTRTWTCRAKRIHEQLTHYGVKDILIYGDCADPDGLRELNQAFERLNSPYYVIAVNMTNKNRSSGILRVEGLLNRKALKVRRGIGRDSLWFQGRNASSNGRPVRGSRLVWEFVNWQYPKSIEGKVVKEEPDDATADGADMMDELRYLVMEWLGPLVVEQPRRALTLTERLQKEFEEMDREAEATDEAMYGTVLRQG